MVQKFGFPLNYMIYCYKPINLEQFPKIESRNNDPAISAIFNILNNICCMNTLP